MRDRFFKAASNDFAYIQKLIESCKDDKEKQNEINKKWDGDLTILDAVSEEAKLAQAFSKKVYDFSRGEFKIPLFGVELPGSILSEPMQPLLVFIRSIALIAEFGTSGIDLINFLPCKGWTMLEFSAKTGATAVAGYLILQGADTNNSFKEIAKQNGHGDNFLNFCYASIDMRTKVIKMINDLKLQIIEQDDKYKLKIETLLAAFKTLLQKTTTYPPEDAATIVAPQIL